MSVSTFQHTPGAQDGAALLESAVKTLSQSIVTAGEYAVELEQGEAAQLRKRMSELADRLERARLPGEYDTIHSSFRGALRSYRDKSAEKIARMRQEIAAAAAVLQSMADGVAEEGENHGAQVREEMAHLRAAAKTAGLAELRQAVARAAASVLESCEKMQRANRVLIAQLRDEVQSLHHEVAEQRRATLTDASTGVWNRSKLDAKIRDLVLADQAFCVFFIGVTNLPRLMAEHTQQRLKAALKAMLGRLAGMIPEDAVPGRWNEDVFAVIFDVPLSVVPLSTQDVETQLGGEYAFHDGGMFEPVDLAVRVCSVQRAKGVREADFYPRVAKAAIAAIMD